jgi:hypothetical protein
VVYADGPRPYSYRDAARILSQLLGREIQVERVRFEAMVPTLTSFGVSTALATAYRQMTEALAEGRIRVEPEHEHRVGPTGLETVLRGLLPSVPTPLSS